MDQKTLKKHIKLLKYNTDYYFEYKSILNNLTNIRGFSFYNKVFFKKNYYFHYSIKYNYIELLKQYQEKITELILPLLLTWNLNKKKIKKTI